MILLRLASIFQNCVCSSSLDLSTAADYDLEFPVIKTEMGPKHRVAAPYYHHYQAQSEVLPQWLGLVNAFPKATLFSNVGEPFTFFFQRQQCTYAFKYG